MRFFAPRSGLRCSSDPLASISRTTVSSLVTALVLLSVVTFSSSQPSLSQSTLNSGTLTLTFISIGPALLASNIDCTKVRLGATSMNFIAAIPLSNNATLDGIGTVICPLGITLRYAIRDEMNFGTSSIDTFVYFDLGNGIVDSMMTEIPSGSSSSGVAISTVTTGPLLTSFNFDLDAGILSLIFGEQLNPLSVNFSLFTIQNAPHALISYTLSSGVSIQTTPTSIIDILLSDVDLNYIKFFAGLATAESNTFLSFDFGALEDIFGNPVSPVSPLSGIMVSIFIPDTSPPYITTFEISSSPNGVDIMLLIGFSETVNIATLTLARFTLLESPSSPNTYTLTGGAIISHYYADVHITLTMSDRDAIKELYPLGSAVNSSYLSANAGAVSDMAGLPLIARDMANALQAHTISTDLTPPSLNSFSLDMNIGVLSLTFSEVVTVPTLDISVLLLQSTSSSSIVNHTIESSSTSDPDGLIVDIYIAWSDLNAIKLETTLGTQLTDTYISFPRGLIQDSAHNPAFAIASSNALQASSYTPDITPPSVVGFYLDMNAGILTIVFGEPVDHSTFDQHQVIIQNSTFQTSSAVRFRNVTGPQFTDTSTDSPILVLPLQKDDLSELQRRPQMAVSQDSTFLALLSSAISDMSGNYAISVSTTSALPVGTFIPDTTRPLIVSFTLDYSLGLLRLTFSEVVDISTLRVSSFTLQNAQISDTNTATFNLTSSSVPPLSMGFNDVVDIVLGMGDLNAIKSYNNFATDVTNTFLSVLTPAILDTSGNLLMSVLSLQADNVIPGSIGPIIQQFTLDLNPGQLSLVFGKPIDSTSIQVALFTLQNSPINSTETVTLTNGTTASLNDLRSTVYITLSDRDLDLLKFRNLASSLDGTYLSVGEGAVSDTAGNAGVSQTIRADVLVTDRIPPSLVGADFNLVSGVLTLIFNEAVDLNSLLLTAIIIAAETDNGNSTLEVVEFRLTGGSAMYAVESLRDVLVTLVREDFDEIRHIGICGRLQASECFAYFPQNSPAIADFSGNLVVTGSISDGVRVKVFVPVLTPTASTRAITVASTYPTSKVSSSCPSGPDIMWNIEWPNTDQDTTVTQNCPGALDSVRGNATRYCNIEGVWSEPDVLSCSDMEFRNILEQANSVFSLHSAEVVMETIQITAQLSELTQPSTVPLLPSSLTTTNQVLSGALQVLEGAADSEDKQIYENVVDVISNVLDKSNTAGWTSLQPTESGGSEGLLNNAERYGELLARAQNNSNSTQPFRISRPNIAISAKQYNPTLKEVEKDDLSFPKEKDLVNYTVTYVPAQIQIPPGLLRERLDQQNNPGDGLPVVFILFQNIEAFLPASDRDTIKNTRVASVVISSQVGEREYLQQSEVLLKSPISMNFSFDLVENASEYRCVSWNFSNPVGNGKWSYDGVSTIKNKSDGFTTTVECTTTHLTSFAVLVDVTGGLKNITTLERTALKAVSYIGCTVSVVCLVISVIFFLGQGKKLLTSLHYFVHLNLSISLLLAYLLFIVGIETAVRSATGCHVVAALLHYLFLSVFCWMLCEGVMLYLLMVVVFSRIARKWWFFLLLGYLTPVPIVVITLAARWQYYGVRDPNGELQFCWLSTEKGTIFGFVVPMFMIMMINVVFLGVTLRALWKNKRSQIKRSLKQEDQHKFSLRVAKSVMLASVVLLPLLGLTWVFGLLTINSNTTFFAWIFTILNSLQGVCIFLFHVVRSDKVWNKIGPRLSSLRQHIMNSTTHKYGLSTSGSTSNTRECKSKSSGGSELGMSIIKSTLPHDEPSKRDLSLSVSSQHSEYAEMKIDPAEIGDEKLPTVQEEPVAILNGSGDLQDDAVMNMVAVTGFVVTVADVDGLYPCISEHAN